MGKKKENKKDSKRCKRKIWLEDGEKNKMVEDNKKIEVNEEGRK